MLDSRIEENPELMLPGNIPEDMFDLLFVQSHALLNSVDKERVGHLNIEMLTNIVSDILRVYDIYELYKDNIGGLIVMYASWVILESLKREELIDFESCSFDNIFDNEVLMRIIESNQDAFEKHLKNVALLD